MTLIDEADAATCPDIDDATLASLLPGSGTGASSTTTAPDDDAKRSLADLADLAPDAALVAQLDRVNLTDVDEYELVEVAAAFQRVAAWANAKLTEVAGELARRPLLERRGALPSRVEAGNRAADELAPRLGISRWAACRMVRNARGFVNTFYETGQALLTGHIDIQKASTIVSMLEDYEPELAYRAQEEVLPDAGLQTHSQLVAAIRKAVIALAHDDADLLHTKARAKRRVDHPRQLPDGMASILAILPATDAVALDLALETAARTARQHGDSRNLDQLRADTLALMGHTALENGYVGVPPDGPLPQPSPIPAQEPASLEVAPPAAEMAPPAEPDMAEPDSAGLTTATDAPPAAQTDAGDVPPTCPTADATSYTCCDGTGHCLPPSEASGAPPGVPGDRTGVPADGTGAPGHRTSVSNGRTGMPADGTVVPGGRCLAGWYMPLGQIGGGRARINITVPLSVLLPSDLAHQLGLPARTDAQGSGPGPLPSSETGIPSPGPSDRGEPAATEPAPSPTATSAELVPLPEDDELLAFLERAPVEVAELEGYGPISPAVARAATLGGTWRRLVTDPLTGIVLDHGRSRYRPPADLAELVRLRDGTCVRPACSSPARIGEIDHTVAWSAGGSTALINLGSLCTRDHLVKTDAEFSLTHLGGGDFEWTTPTGHVYRRHRGGRVTLRGATRLHPEADPGNQPHG